MAQTSAEKPSESAANGNPGKSSHSFKQQQSTTAETAQVGSLTIPGSASMINPEKTESPLVKPDSKPENAAA